MTVDERSVNKIGTSAGLRAGDVVTLKDLLYGLLLPSGNDAAEVLARYIGSVIKTEQV